MIWHEDESNEASEIPDSIQDLSFRVEAKTLPLDHASVLSDSILEKLPWLTDEPGAGIHLLNYPESGNGWVRENDSTEALFFPSKRIRLRLRLPKQRIKDARLLTGCSLSIDGHKITVGKSKIIPLSKSSTLFARRIIFHQDESEESLTQRILSEFAQYGISIKKILCGKCKLLQRYGAPLPVRSVMLADLHSDESIHLQQLGFGPGRLYGCGIFIPHKSIRPTRLST